MNRHSKHPVSTDMVVHGIHHKLASFEIKTSSPFIFLEKPDRKEQCSILRKEQNVLMTTFRAKERTKLKHVINWLKLFIDFHNQELNLK